ncbi:hypothetical protein [Sandarakinorhabdus sp. DWP1-3-1]|uniref:hypothetical protein n=1 Tax=Sandarakinorhabdus sp. DWP1-3-1 TaxID=2804627 RepID=UPI003CF7B777
MIITAPITMLHLESDLDAGIAARLLDLLTVQRRLPERLVIDWLAHGIRFTLDFKVDTDLSASLLARLRQLPGMRAVSLGPRL